MIFALWLLFQRTIMFAAGKHFFILLLLSVLRGLNIEVLYWACKGNLAEYDNDIMTTHKNR